MAAKRHPVPQQRHGCLFWLFILFVAGLALLVAIAISPPVLIVGVLLALLVVLNPGRAGDGVRRWSVWNRVPFLGARSSAAGFATVLLLYTVPVPGFLTYMLVASGQSNGSASTSVGSTPDAPTPPPGNSGGVAASTPSSTQPTASSDPTPTASPVVSLTPPPTALPARAPTAVPAGPRTPPPPAPPASTCTASVKFPTPGDGGDETVYVRSNVPNAAVTIAVHYKTTTHMFGTSTDGSGSASDTFSIGRPTIGYQVIVDVSVGSAACQTSFTPQ